MPVIERREGKREVVLIVRQRDRLGHRDVRLQGRVGADGHGFVPQGKAGQHDRGDVRVVPSLLGVESQQAIATAKKDLTGRALKIDRLVIAHTRQAVGEVIGADDAGLGVEPDDAFIGRTDPQVAGLVAGDAHDVILRQAVLLGE